jgi:hypothetical protein
MTQRSGRQTEERATDQRIDKLHVRMGSSSEQPKLAPDRRALNHRLPVRGDCSQGHSTATSAHDFSRAAPEKFRMLP